MQRGRLLILVGLLLLIATGGVFLVLSRFGQAANAEATPGDAVPTSPPVDVTQIVIAVQPLPRGSRIPPEAVALAPWPSTGLPPVAITDIEDVVGKIARYDIDRGSPVFSTLIADDVSQLSSFGSDAALRIPQGLVAVTIPITRLSAVGYALREGDHVNVLVSVLFVSLDEAFQTILPNALSLITTSTDPTTGATSINPLALGAQGPFSTDNPLGTASIIQPVEPQRPRLVVQQVVQDAIVLKVGTFTGNDFAPTETPLPAPPPADDSTPPPTVTPVPPPDIITLVVSPQDSQVLTYYVDSGARITLTLRAAGDVSRVDTESVTLQYTIERFRISVPTPLSYGLHPAVYDLKPPALPNDAPPQLIQLPDGSFICAGSSCP